MIVSKYEEGSARARGERVHSNKLQYKETSLSLSVHLFFFLSSLGCVRAVCTFAILSTPLARARGACARYLEAVVKQETVHYYGLTFPFSRLSPITLHNSSVHSSFRSLARARITLFRKTRRRYVKVSLSHQVELYRRRAGRSLLRPAVLRPIDREMLERFDGKHRWINVRHSFARTVEFRSFDRRTRRSPLIRVGRLLKPV